MQIATTIGVVFPGIMHSIVILILLLLPFKIKKSSACILACLPTKVTLKLICFFCGPSFFKADLVTAGMENIVVFYFLLDEAERRKNVSKSNYRLRKDTHCCSHP